MKKRYLSIFLSSLVIGTAGCNDSATTAPTATSSSCTLTANTTEGATSANGCALLTRDTSACQASRVAQGLSGFWLKFSCRVTLTKSGNNVSVVTDSQPDYKSAYFATSNACYSAGFPSGRAANPNTLGAQSITMTIPYTPSGATSSMPMGAIGVAINGVVIFSNAAAPGDDIYTEVATFDKCEGHPAGTMYHYHTEPTTASQSDSNFIGVMRDGNPIYGYYDAGTQSPTLNLANGGAHSGTTVDSSSAVNHYHVNLQTNGTDSTFFITKGTYLNTAGVCTGCN